MTASLSAIFGRGFGPAFAFHEMFLQSVAPVKLELAFRIRRFVIGTIHRIDIGGRCLSRLRYR